jgi:hypothetical protein
MPILKFLTFLKNRLPLLDSQNTYTSFEVKSRLGNGHLEFLFPSTKEPHPLSIVRKQPDLLLESIMSFLFCWRLYHVHPDWQPDAEAKCTGSLIDQLICEVKGYRYR